MSPTPDAQPRTTDSSDDRMNKRRVDKRYDPETGSLSAITFDVGDERGTYRVEFEHSSHGRLTFERLISPDGDVWVDVDGSAHGDVHEAILVASRAAWDERLGTETPLSGTEIAVDVDLYDDINPGGFVQSPDSEDVTVDGGD